MTYWLKLPAEIRCIILKSVSQDYRFSEDKYSRAGYASVCREWQGVFEPWNFRRLILDQDRIFGLKDYMSKRTTAHRREYTTHIMLRIRLEEYDCSVCQSKEDNNTIHLNDLTFSRAIWQLLAILSRWPAFTGRERLQTFGAGLTLELGAYSASDSEHTFRDFRLKPSYPIQSPRDIDDSYTSYCLHDQSQETLDDPTHGWVDGHQAHFAQILEGAKKRLTGTLTLKYDLPEFPSQRRKLPAVKIITGLLIRRQFYRQISAQSLGKLLSQACSNLEWFRYEKWDDTNHPATHFYHRIQDDPMQRILQNLPSTFRKLSLFEDFNSIINPKRQSDWYTCPCFAESLAQSSRSLESLSASFIVDAEYFFSEFTLSQVDVSTVPKWENLKTVALTSSILIPANNHSSKGDLLQAAGIAAASMPKLEIMELWNGDKGISCIFRYINNVEGHGISWESSFYIETPFCPETLSYWTGLQRHPQYGNCDFTVTVTKVKRDIQDINSHAYTISNLKLKDLVLDSFSYYELFWEGNNREIRNIFNTERRKGAEENGEINTVVQSI
ncbi:hypothetical protein IFR05_011015 [Cadophora sp. M221]|nr:hypothetical protein IFR05_011015 [Cadophora sp. M221]